MLDLALPHIGSGDVVIVTPEISAQTLSLYYDGLETYLEPPYAENRTYGGVRGWMELKGHHSTLICTQDWAIENETSPKSLWATKANDSGSSTRKMASISPS